MSNNLNNAQNKPAASQKKEAIEISCPECDTHFRLWVPQGIIQSWDKGARISCIKCGALHLIKKGMEGFSAHFIKEVTAPMEQSVGSAAAKAAPAKKTPEPQEVSGEVVLIVEDDKFSREMVQNTLEDMGITLITAKNGVEALKAVRKFKVKLVVADLYLKNPADPEAVLDGEDLLNKILEAGFNIPSIITTGKDIIDDMVLDPKWFDMHVKGFIQKGNPFWAEELKLKIKEILYKD